MITQCRDATPERRYSVAMARLPRSSDAMRSAATSAASCCRMEFSGTATPMPRMTGFAGARLARCTAVRTGLARTGVMRVEVIVRGVMRQSLQRLGVDSDDERSGRLNLAGPRRRRRRGARSAVGGGRRLRDG